MSAYSHYQYPQFEADSLFWSNLNPIQPDQSTEEYSVDKSARDGSRVEQQSMNNESVVKQSNVGSSISMADIKSGSHGRVARSLCGTDRKRKLRNGSSSFTANSEETKQVKCKKVKGEKEVKKEVKNEKQNKDKNQANEEPPKGYIHVRARRGQATDSHSLAERVRREKISERMKVLQALVPGCDKVTGKALMLDEIINYVQSLQNQVEFLSLKLASLDPMVHTFGLMDIESLTFGIEGMKNNLALPMLQQMPCTTISGTINGATYPFALPAEANMTTATAATTSTTTFSYPFGDTSTNLLELEQKPNVLPLQDGRSSYWGVLDDQQQQTQSNNIINQLCFTSNNFCCNFY